MRKTRLYRLSDGSEFHLVYRHSGFAQFAADVIRKRDFNNLPIVSVKLLNNWWEF